MNLWPMPLGTVRNQAGQLGALIQTGPDTYIIVTQATSHEEVTAMGWELVV